MTGTVHDRGQGRFRFHITLNSDGQSHKLVNVLTIFVLVVGLVSFVLGLVIRNGAGGVSWAAITTSAGLVSMLVGLYTQMISATREQRALIVTGIIAGFVGFAIGLAHGGFGG
jgi:hypothetical protein